MTFSDEYIKILERVYELTKNGQTERIEIDFSIPKMFGAWSSIFWALPHLDKFGGLTLEELKHLLKALIKSHISYEATTNQYLRIETVNWLAGTLKIKAMVFGTDNNEGLYAEQWVNQLFENPETKYDYTVEIGERLLQEKETNDDLNKKLNLKKIERLQKEEQENEKRQAEKQKTCFKHLESNRQQKEKRAKFLKNFSGLSLLDKLKLITKESKSLQYYPTDIANVPNDIIQALTFEERNRLYDMTHLTQLYV